MKKLFTPIIAALVALTAISAASSQAEARRYRGALAFGVASAIIGGAIIASHRRGYYGYDDYGYGYGYGYGYPRRAYYGYDDGYDDDYYNYAPRRSYYYSSYGYAPRYYGGYGGYGGYRVIRPHRNYVRLRHHRGRHYGRAVRARY